MSEKLVISVDGPNDTPDLMRVQDVFSHVLELFELASKSESDPENTIVWRLVNVSMNSPLTVTAEAVGVRPGVNVEVIAQAQKREFANNLMSLRRGVIPRVWGSDAARKSANNLLYRNRNGIGSTKVFVATPESPTVEISHADAEAAVAILAGTANEALLLPTKRQIGSIEGRIIDVSNHYNKPAIAVKERKTGNKVWCVVSDEFRREIANEATFDDVWSEQRVVVTGIISYDRERKISRVDVSHVRKIDSIATATTDIADAKFTAGMTAVEYLEKFREGTLD